MVMQYLLHKYWINTVFFVLRLAFGNSVAAMHQYKIKAFVAYNPLIQGCRSIVPRCLVAYTDVCNGLILGMQFSYMEYQILYCSVALYVL